MFLAIDTETTGGLFTTGDRPYFVSTCDSEGNTRYWRFPVTSTRQVVLLPEIIQEIQSYIDQFDSFVFHNAKFDLEALESIGIFVPYWEVEDTALQYHVLDNQGSLRLKDLALQHFQFSQDDEKNLLRAIQKARGQAKKLGWVIARPDHTSSNKKSNDPWMKVDAWLPGELAKHLQKQGKPFPEDWLTCLELYGTSDVERTAALHMLCNESLRKQNLWEVYRQQLPLIRVLKEMHERGLSVRRKELFRQQEHYASRIEHYTQEMRTILKDDKFNPGSSSQLQKVLYGKYKLPVLKRTKTGISTDADTLDALFEQHSKSCPILNPLRAFKKASKSFSTCNSYIKHLRGHKIYGSLNQTGTDTIRLSASSPNLQNVKKADEYEDGDESEVAQDDYNLRANFGPLKDRIWVDNDYNQLQLRIFAFVSGETRMIKAFEEGWDAHNFMASQIYKTKEPTKAQRRVAKAINFGFIFGAQPDKIALVSGSSETWSIVTRLFPNAVKFLDVTSRDTERLGYVSVHGYRLYVPRNDRGRPKGYTGVVYKVQGYEGLIVKRAMWKCDEQFRFWRKQHGNDFGYLALQVHDELIGDFGKMEKTRLKPFAFRMKQIMEDAGSYFGMTTPASVEIVEKSWDRSTKWDNWNVA